MDATAVNWSVLDAMVIDYCLAEGLLQLQQQQQQQQQQDSNREAIKQIRSLIERGCITDAVGLITRHASPLLQDQRFLFWLYKQHFIEMLRDGDTAARLRAIECSRVQLGPCALNAYPEAYEEFKRLLLALIYDSAYQNSPVAEEWCEARRSKLAATVASTLKAHLQAEEPLFSMTLCYLISVHNAYCIRKNVPSPIGDVAGNVLLKERDPPPALHDSFVDLPNFEEVDVQALAQAAELPRQDAVQSLRYTRGDVMAALKSELSRMRLNSAIVDKLVWEYCVYRGLVDSPDVDASTPNASGAKHYRWKGRLPSDLLTGLERQLMGTTDADGLAAPNSEAADPAVEKYRRSVQIRQLITERKISEAIKEVQFLDPNFFDKYPQLLFQLKQIAFCAFVEAGDHSGALEVARVDLGPLAARYPDLLKPMKETLLSMACNPGETTTTSSSAEQISAAGLAASVQITLSTSLGITEPQLMKIMRTCLYAHTEWFKVQMCCDRFAELLNISALKQREGDMSKPPSSKKTGEVGAAQQPATEKPPFDESSILTIMEWMALPRGDAIQLLAEYDGSVDEVFAQLMG